MNTEVMMKLFSRDKDVAMTGEIDRLREAMAPPPLPKSLVKAADDYRALRMKRGQLRERGREIVASNLKGGQPKLARDKQIDAIEAEVLAVSEAIGDARQKLDAERAAYAPTFSAFQARHIGAYQAAVEQLLDQLHDLALIGLELGAHAGAHELPLLRGIVLAGYLDEAVREARRRLD